MYKILVIAHREYSAMVVTKSFLVTLILMPIMMLGGLIIMPQVNKLSGGKTRRVLVVDGTGQMRSAIEQAVTARNQLAKAELPPELAGEDGPAEQLEGMRPKLDRLELEFSDTPELADEDRLRYSEQMREGKLYAFVEIPTTALSDPSPDFKSASFCCQEALLSESRAWLEKVIESQIHQKRLVKEGLDPAIIRKAEIPFSLMPKIPYSRGADGKIKSESGVNVLGTILLPLGVMMLMFLVIFMAAQPMLESGMEEKTQRIAEVLLGSVSPTQLMAGKLIGNVGASLMIFAIYAVGGWLILERNHLSHFLPMWLIPWFLVFQVLGVLFFSSIFLTIGASISELKEAQSLLLPVWLLLVAPLMVWFVALRDPNGIVAVVLSFFPPSSPMMMTLRLASGQTIPAWHPPLAVISLLIATSIVIYIAGRIYRAGLLRNDSAKSFTQLIRRLSRT